MTYTLELHPDTHPAETQRPDYWRSQITGRVVSMLSDADKVAPHLGDRLRAVLLCATNLERLARGAAPLVNDETEETSILVSVVGEQVAEMKYREATS